MAKSTIKTASVLAFERKLANSDAIMLAGEWGTESWQPIVIKEKAVRGTISNRLKTRLPAIPPSLMLKFRSQTCKRLMLRRCRKMPIP